MAVVLRSGVEVICPRCSYNLSALMPAVGEVWLTPEDGVLYRITESVRRRDSGSYGTAERCWPAGPQGCDVRATLAVWPDHVAAGKWIRVTTPLDKAAQCMSVEQRKESSK